MPVACACFHLVPHKMTWDDAQKYCRANHTDLAIFRTESEYEALENPCGLDKYCWIGLHRDDTNAAVWNWANGEEVSFTSWATNEPNDLWRNENCTVMENKLWIDIPCHIKFESLCSEDDLILVKEEKTWEEALEHCRTLQTDPDSKDTHFNHLYDLPHMHAEHNNRYVKDLIQNAQTKEVWIGLRFLAGNWLWVNGFPLEEQLLVCPKPKMNCGTMSKTGTRLFRDCSGRRNFFSRNTSPLVNTTLNKTLSHTILSNPTIVKATLIKPTHSHFNLQISRIILQ
ncbi:secretory phospholipase A2 receptor-like [Labrus mixtus]|uniref:secretory phospholipase A2 receptor-like n=1 Tax=Labrus mixtus TaxID=508554 RepID=UPI0029C0A18B|nr:secretory phospholipase A2 receptor-like [Labrus mixtus]